TTLRPARHTLFPYTTLFRSWKVAAVIAPEPPAIAAYSPFLESLAFSTTETISALIPLPKSPGPATKRPVWTSLVRNGKFGLFSASSSLWTFSKGFMHLVYFQVEEGPAPAWQSMTGLFPRSGAYGGQYHRAPINQTSRARMASTPTMVQITLSRMVTPFVSTSLNGYPTSSV